MIEILEHLIATDQVCGVEPLLSKNYAAHFSYGAALEQNGDRRAAIAQYQAAFAIDARRNEALNALVRLHALPAPTTPSCRATAGPVSASDLAPMPASLEFMRAKDKQLYLGEQPLKIKGVNYYPRKAPWQFFLAEADPEDVEIELTLIEQAGFNTLRMFLHYEPLFTCKPEDAVPVEATFKIVDRVLELARQHHLKVIVTLNDLPDLIYRPLYTDWAHYDAQTAYIVRRYRNDPTILAWDLRNEGDLDYGVRIGDNHRFRQNEVIQWLAHVHQIVRENDQRHLLTAGWWGDPTVTSPYVDVLSFHHWSGPDELQFRIGEYQTHNEKPLLLEEVGYHSWADAPQDRRDSVSQADILGRVINIATHDQIAGWLIWTAFDFVPQPGQPATYEHFFGLWQTDLKPKPALQALLLP